tara:strand:- start:164 stop:433 length:270 start_codon:yes stop_codon:yes gene_type:complete
MPLLKYEDYTMRNVSRKTRNAMRRDSNMNPSTKKLIARKTSETPIKRQTREQAVALYRELKDNGATWAQCVQAIKTDWVSQLKNKYRVK